MEGGNTGDARTRNSLTPLKLLRDVRVKPANVGVPRMERGQGITDLPLRHLLPFLLRSALRHEK